MFFVFFFQAEDGIRDVAVTGVQTCALPISAWTSGAGRQGAWQLTAWTSGAGRQGAWRRSEERRVGKECRSRWSPYPKKKKLFELIVKNITLVNDNCDRQTTNIAKQI